MKPHIRRACLALLSLVTIVPPVSADITTTTVRLPGYPSISNAVAFDKVNQVYLMTRWDRNPLAGNFLDRNGSPIGAEFAIASAAEGSLSAWSQIAFGGPSTDPTFLVTYLGTNGSVYTKYGRLIRYRNGAAEVGPPIPIVSTGGQWQAAEKAQSVWFNDHFIVGTRVTIGLLPQPIVQRFEMSGQVSAPVSLGDSLDFEGSPTLACATSGVCLATGYAGGYPFNAFGGSVFARLFNADTLQPVSGLFYLDDHTSRMDEPWVVFNTVTGEFLTVWTQAGTHAQFRTVSTTGALGSYDHRLSDWAGNIALRFNAATGTAILATKWRNLALHESRWADLYAVEVDSNFRMTPILVAPWDGRWNEYWTSIAADEVNGRWLITSAEGAGGRAAVVQGLTGPVTPPVFSNPQMSIDAPGSGSTHTDWVTVGGWAVDLAASGGPGVDAIHVWAFPTNGGQPVFFGAAAMGGFRPDVGAVFGGQFNSSGYNLAGTLPAGYYDLAVYAHSSVTGTFNNSRSVRIRVRPAASTPQLAIDAPQPNASLGTGVTVAGWAIDLGAASGNGVDAVHVWAWPAAGGQATFFGATAPNAPRPDVANVFGSQFGSSGYQVAGTLPPGTYDLAVYAHSAVAGTFNMTRAVRVSIGATASKPYMAVDAPTAGQTVGQSFTVAGWAIDQAAWSSTGVDAIHAWAYPANGAPLFAGAATGLNARSDIAAAFGSTFLASGFSFTGTLPPGTYNLVVYARSTVAGTFNNAISLPITVQ